MNSVYNIPYQLIVKDFYKRNSWWLLVILLAFFGLVQKPVMLHTQIMVYIGNNCYGLLAFCGIITLYTLHIILFQNKIFQSSHNDCLQLLRLLPPLEKTIIAIRLELTILAPIIIYNILTIIVGFSRQLYNHAIILLLVQLFLICFSSFFFLKSITGIHFRYFPKLILSKNSFKHYFSFFTLTYLWRTKKKKILWIIIANLLILSIPVIRNRDHFQFADFTIFWMVMMGGNLMLLYDMFIFSNREQKFIRQLPIHSYRIFLQVLLSISLLNIPEFILIYRYRNSISDIQPLAFLLYSVGMQNLLYHLQWDMKNDLSTFGGTSALILLLQLFLVPYHQFIVLGLLFMGISYIMFSGGYYKYEYQNRESN